MSEEYKNEVKVTIHTKNCNKIIYGCCDCDLIFSLRQKLAIAMKALEEIECYSQSGTLNNRERHLTQTAEEALAKIREGGK